jgi:small basic protein (TIGR04137 family)
MSLDKSLKTHGALVRHRNVLTRAERIEALKAADKWKQGDTVFGLPKVAHRKVTTKKVKAVVAAAEGAEAVPGAAPAEGEAAKAAAPGKAAAPKAAAAPTAKAAGPKAAGPKGKA